MRGVRIRAGSRMAAWLMWCQTGNKYGSSWEWDLHTCAQSASCSGCFLFAVLLIVCVAHILTVSLYGSCHKHHALHFYVIYLFLYFGWRWVPEGGICFFFYTCRVWERQFLANACAVTSFSSSSSSSSLYHRDMKPSLSSHQALTQIHYIDYIEMFSDFSLSGSSCRALTHATTTDDDALPTLSVKSFTVI